MYSLSPKHKKPTRIKGLAHTESDVPYDNEGEGGDFTSRAAAGSLSTDRKRRSTDLEHILGKNSRYDSITNDAGKRMVSE